jgi:proteasome component ECM29
VVAMQIAVREAKRQNVAYRPHAIKALAEVAAARRDVDMSAIVLEIVAPLIDEQLQDDPMDVDGDKAKTSTLSEV